MSGLNEMVTKTAAPPAILSKRERERDGSNIELTGEIAQFITFTVGSEEYGVDIMDVREIKGWTHATRLPNAPIFVRGVINLRGTMIPVYDLRARFSMGETEVTQTHVIVIVNVNARIIGILVDAVSDILSLDRVQIQPVPDMDRAIETQFLRGLVMLDDRMVALLTLDNLFRIEDMKKISPELEPVSS